MALAPLLYNITFDSQTRILYFWDKAGHEIYHCEIASHAPALPTVSMSYAYPNQLWNYSENIGAGGNSVLRDQNGNPLSYDSTKSYSALNYYTSTSDSAGTIDTNVSIGASGSFLALFNNGSSQITVQRVNVATCNSTDATVITVYDSSNNPYNAFQYTSDGTDYYYVLDGTQTDWTDDLESIGYHVIYTAYFTNQGASATGDITVQNDITYRLYDANGIEIPFDTTKTYKYVGSYKYDGNPTYRPSGYDPAALWYFPYDYNLSYLNIQTNGNKKVFRFEYMVL
jgi:hypothetical protein